MNRFKAQLMIAIDTNILVRFLTNDDATQAMKARTLIRGNTTVLITDVVLVETLWALKGDRYNATKDELVQAVLALFDETNIVFEQNAVIWSALQDYIHVRETGKRAVGFADALIARKALWCIEARKQDCEGIYTFDKKAAQEVPYMKAP